VDLVEAIGADQSAAAIRLDIASTTDFGGVATGVLGVTENLDTITIVSGWNWYVGADPSAIGPNQYDFETVVAHELGHTLGLGEGSDAASVMYGYLASGVARRALSAGDLGVIASVEGAGRSTTQTESGSGTAGPGAEPAGRIDPGTDSPPRSESASATEAVLAALSANALGAASPASAGITSLAAPVASGFDSSTLPVHWTVGGTSGPAVTIWTAAADAADAQSRLDAPVLAPPASPDLIEGSAGDMPHGPGAGRTGAASSVPSEQPPFPAAPVAPALDCVPCEPLLFQSRNAYFAAAAPAPLAMPSVSASVAHLAAAGLALGLAGCWSVPEDEGDCRRYRLK
jgi:hypothetical protein